MTGITGLLVLGGHIANASSAEAAAATNPILKHAGWPMLRFDSTFTEALPWIAPGVATLSQGPHTRHGAVVFRWDSRLARAVSPACLVSADGRMIELPAAIETKGSEASLTVRLSKWPHQPSSGEDLRVYSAIKPLDATDMPGLDDPVATTVELLDASGRVIAVADQISRRLGPAEGRAWSAQTSVVWGVPFEGAEADRYSYPQVVKIESPGPGKIPAGAQVVMHVSGNTVGRLGVIASELDGVAVELDTSWAVRANDGMLTVTLKDPVTPGSSLRISLEAQHAEVRAPSKEARAACWVTTTSGRTAPQLQRITGRETCALGA